MRSEERQQYILKTAQENGFISIPKTAETLGVSVETIRRDVNFLSKKRLLKKVHGGASPIKAPIWKDEPYFTRFHRNQQGKMAIAAEAVKMIHNGNIVSFDGGATTAVLVSLIQNVNNVTFVVNSLPIATTLVDKVTAGEISGTIIMTGGQINSPGYRTYFPMALDTIDKYRYNIVFVSCTALNAGGAFSNATNPGVFSQHLMRHASSCVLLVDSEKLGKTSVFEFAQLTEFDRIITDDIHPCPPDIIQALEGTDTELTIVSCKHQHRDD